MSSKNKKRKVRNSYLLKRYGITIEQYEEMLKQQNGLCAICKRPPKTDKNGKLKSLAVDHHHKYKGARAVRGLLCWTCNKRLISNLGDRENAVELFTRAAEYLKDFILKIEKDKSS